MATARSQEAICRLVEDRTLELETEAGRKPDYNGVVVTEDTLLVIDKNARNLQVHIRQDGKLYKSHELESNPMDVCLISKTEVAVCLLGSEIVILSFKSVHDVKLVKTLDVSTGSVLCDSVAKWNSDKLVVSGRKHDMLCWGVVSITDGRLHSTHDICTGEWSHMAIQDNTVYISCRTWDPITHGVYAYDILNPHTHKFLYQHKELEPGRIMADRDFVYVIDFDSNRIHQLTDSGQLVTIHTVSSRPYGIFYDDQHGVLYTTRMDSNLITVYKMEYSHQTGIPTEILKMDSKSIQLFKEALKDGKETVYSIRIMVVGHMGVGKTTLVKRLLGEEVNISDRHSTEGIDVYVNCCDVSLSTHEWTRRKKDSEQDYKLQRLVKVLNENYQTGESIVDSEQDASSNQRESTDSNPMSNDANNDNIEVIYHRSQQQNLGQNLSSTSGLQEESPSTVVQSNLTQSETNTIPGSELGENVATESDKTDPLREMLKLLHQNPDKAIQDVSKYAHLTMLDFAGQYAFYTTHQIFLTRRAIYLLVSDASRDVSDLVEDECYFDSEGIMKCKVHELVGVWLNSIHSCAPPDKEVLNSTYSHTSPYTVIPPPVILVGTHVDQIPQRQKAIRATKEYKQPHILQTGMDTSITTSKPTFSREQPTLSISQESLQTSTARLERKRRATEQVFPSSIQKGAQGSEDHLKKQRKSRQSPQRKTRDKTEKRFQRTLGQRYLMNIRTYLKDKPTAVHLVDEDFAIDNTVLDSKLNELKRKIVEVASQQPYWGEQIPTRWFLLEQQLMRLKDAGIKVISHSIVEDLNKELTVRIEESEELDLFLRYLHETGTIIYFSIEVLRDNIVLDPKWLIDALKSLINAHLNLPNSPADNGTESNSPAASAAHSDITQKWFYFKEKGILSVELVDAIWTKEKHPEFYAHRNHILLLLEQLNIIAKPKSFSEIGEMEENYFLAPCMLRQESPKEVISPEQDPQMVSTPLLRWVFTGKFLPSPIFHRLLAACVSHWPVAKKETSENLIFCGCCVFDIDLFHRLTLYFKNHVVFARITRMVIDEVKTLDAKLCSRVRRFITLNLSKITSYLGQNLRYELRVSLPCPVWFADEEHDPHAPITPEHMNHARLCVALVTVCGKALRDILLTNFPVPYKDIYQAILANKVSLTKRQGRPLLNPDQSQLVFPDPQGQTTGTVDQFDLSLLYTLIRNISTVTAPLTGWGNDPQDQPRDTSLGASVERIRSYRNHISGHSPDGKISRQDLEDYWNKFDAVLHDIEAVMGGQVYSQEFGKQKRQVISIYEAC